MSEGYVEIQNGNILVAYIRGDFMIRASTMGDDYWQAAETVFTVTVTGSADVPIAPPELTLSDLAHVYDGMAKSATLTTDPMDLTATITYDGAMEAPVDAGSYEVVAMVDSGRYQATITNTLEIAKAMATIGFDMDTLSQVKTEVKAVGVTTDPETLADSVMLTYGGNAELPTEVGEYEVMASIDHLNYEGSATATLEVVRVPQVITVPDLASYNPWPIMMEGVPLQIPLNAITTSEEGSGDPSLITFEIDDTQGAQNRGLGTIMDNNILQVTKTGVIHVVARHPGDETHWAPGELTFTVEVNGQDVVIREVQIILSNLGQIYDGTPKSVEVQTEPKGLKTVVTYDGSEEFPVETGSYVVKAVVDDDPIFAGSVEGTLVIIGAEVNAFSFVPETLSQPINEFKPVEVMTDPADLEVVITYDGKTELPTEVRDYSLVAVITSRNWSGRITGFLTVEKKTPHLKVTNQASYSPWRIEMNRQPLSIPLYTQTDDPALQVIYSVVSGEATVNNTTQPAVLVVNQPGDIVVAARTVETPEWQSEEVQFTVTVNGLGIAVPGTITLSDTTQVYGGVARMVAVETDPAGLNTTVTYNGSPNAPVNAGTYAVVVTIDDEAYTGTQTGTLEITRAEAGLVLDPASLSQVVTAINPVTATTFPAGLAVRITYNGTETLPTDVGDYEVVASVDEDNWMREVTATLTIGKGDQTISVTNLEGYQPWPVKMTGEPIEIPLNAISDSGLAVTFSIESDDADIEGAVLTVRQPGDYTVMVMQAGNNNWNSAETTFTVTVEGEGVPTIAPQLSFSTLNEAGLTVNVTGTPNTTVAILATDDLINGEYTVVETVDLDENGGGWKVLATVGTARFFKAAFHQPEE